MLVNLIPREIFLHGRVMIKKLICFQKFCLLSSCHQDLNNMELYGVIAASIINTILNVYSSHFAKI